MLDSLSKPVVINTRPFERAAPLTQYLQRAGFTVVDIPMLTLQTRRVTDNDRQLMRRWLDDEYRALVIVSPTAAALGIKVWQDISETRDSKDVNSLASIDIAPSPLIAVGSATAAVFYGELPSIADKILQPIVANNEGMLAMPEIDGLQAGDKLLIWRGLGGRRLLVDTLQARGVHVDTIAWYERIMPADAQRQYHEWQQNYSQLPTVKPIVIVSSGTAFEHWAHIVNSEADVDVSSQLGTIDSHVTSKASHTRLQLSDFTYVALGARLADMLSNQQLPYLQVEDLAPQTIASAISTHLTS